MSQNLIRAIIGLTGINVALTATTTYLTDQKLERNYEESEARMDELEGTLRGHIGIIEESLERIEGVLSGAAGSGKEGSGWGKGMGKKAEELYGGRGRDEKKDTGKK